jgi:septum formation protein
VIIPPLVDEMLPERISKQQAVMYLALKKALNVEKICGEGIIIAADTLVYKDRIIGKPRDEADAFEILNTLRNTRHEVITGIAIIERGTCLRKVFYETSRVFFKDFTDEAMQGYIASGEAWDKAGGYAIQGEGGQFVDYIEGDYDNVVGFPWTRIKRELSGFGLRV